jgi:hypothetical protein
MIPDHGRLQEGSVRRDCLRLLIVATTFAVGRDLMEAVLVSLLAPFLRELLEGPLRAAEDFAGQAGSAAWKYAESIWRKLWPKLEERSAAQEAVHDVAADPDDKDAQGALRVQLKKLLEQDPGLAGELKQLLEHAQRDGVVAGRDVNAVHGGVHATDHGIAVGHDVAGNISITEK